MSVIPTNTLLNEVTDFLASAPTSEEIVQFRPSEALDQRLHELLDKNKLGRLTTEESEELDAFLQMNHFLITLRAKAYKNCIWI